MAPKQLAAVGKIVSHPLRVAILKVIAVDDEGKRKRSPNELADVLDEPVGNVSYHMKTLRDAGLVKLVGTVPRRGAVEHFYLRNDASELLPPVLALVGGAS